MFTDLKHWSHGRKIGVHYIHAHKAVAQDIFEIIEPIDSQRNTILASAAKGMSGRVETRIEQPS